MAEQLFKVSELTEKFNCVVCHNTLFQPKDLPCRHVACNDCLDGLVSFKKDGSGTLQCPHGCDGVIKISANDSVSSMLSLNYLTQDLLSYIKGKNEIDLSLCQDGGSNCDGMACNSCSVCSKKTCTSCWKYHHNCEIYFTSTSVIFDERKGSFEVLCKHHGAHARGICIDCGNKFICVYCSNRIHQTHMKDTIENHAGNLKSTLSIEFENRRNEPIISSISYKEKLKNIAEQRIKLENELQERIVKTLNHHARSLIQQKEILLQKFDAKVVEYETNLNEFGFIQGDYEEVFSSYIDKLNAKPFFEILSEKYKIMQKSETLSSIHCFMASLTGHDIEELYIGDLYVKTSKKNEMQEDDKVVDVIYEKSYQTDEKCVNDLDDLIKSVTDLELSYDVIHPEIRQAQKTKYSFEDMLQLMKDDKINELELLLKYQPDVIHLKNSSKETLIYKASELGKHKSLRLLLDTNIDDIDTFASLYTPLIIASKNGHTLCVELLLQHSCDVNIKVAHNDRTALMVASMRSKVDCVRILLANDADTDIRSGNGKTAIDYANTDEIKQIITTHINNK